MKLHENIIQFQDKTYLASAEAIVITDEKDFLKPAEEPGEFGGYKNIVPWGAENKLPETIIEKIGEADIVQANLFFNVMVAYGQGLKPMYKEIVDGKATYKELDITEKADKDILEFFDNNDLDGFYLEQVTDMTTFFNVFPEIILNQAGTKILQLRHKEAAFSRWGSISGKEPHITKHYYCAKWGDSPEKDDITETKVLDRFNPIASLAEYKTTDKAGEYRYILPVHFPTPGRSYYQLPYWWSIFKSGWFDFLVSIPKIKAALLKNQMGIRYIIYLHPDYMTRILEDEGIDLDDKEAVTARLKQEYQDIQDFATGEESAGRALISYKNYRAVASGVVEEKHIEVIPLVNKMEGGEFNTDIEEISNIISYAMQVHSSMIGSTPGKSKGSMGGTDKRELFLMKQSTMVPFVNRILRTLYVIKKFNKWDDRLVFINPKVEFTTLDENKTGQQTKVEE